MKKTALLIFISIVCVNLAYSQVSCSQGPQNHFFPPFFPFPDPFPSGWSNTPVYEPVDPNEIIGMDGWMAISEGDTVRWVSAEQSLPYTIYFENDPERATAAAQVVTVRLPLDPLMNMADYAIGTFGFGSHIFTVEGGPLQYQNRLDLRDEMNLYVDVVAGIDITTNEAFWIFSSIDPETGVAPTEAERGFLPVNDSTHAGEGFVTFTIKPKTAQCHTGDTIAAQASIVFDINDPIVTNTWTVTIDAVPPVSTATVIEDTLQLDSVRVVFSGIDDTTGIAAYRLYYTEGHSAFRLAGRYSAGDTAIFATEPNTRYSFFSIAEDNVGNIEPMKDIPDTLMGNTFVQLLVSVTPIGTATFTGTGSYAQGDTATLTLHPTTGYRLTRWTEEGIPQGIDTLLTFIAERDRVLIAEMQKLRYPCSIEAATGTTITVSNHTDGTPVMDSITHFDTLDIHLSSSPCFSDVAYTLNGQPLALDTTLVVIGAITLTSTASTHIDTGFVCDTVCPGTAYTANGFNILSTATQNSGSFRFQVSSPSLQGCDSVTQLSLFVKNSHTITFLANGGTGNMSAQRVCEGDAAVLNRSTFSREGYFFAGWALTSTETTALYADGDIINADNDITLYAVWSSSCVDRVANRIVTACDSYTWKDSTYTASGQYTQTLTAVVPGGCDSIYQLHLTLKHSTNNLQQVYACRQYTWIDGITYTTDTTRQLSLTNAEGCDSLITLQLSLGDDVTATEQVTVCDSLHWIDGNTYHQSVSGPFATIPSMYGCDSTVRLQLTVNYSDTGIEVMTACDSFAWHGQTFTASTNTPTYTSTNMVGCDSITTLNLTVNYSNTGTESLTTCDSLSWHGNTYTTNTNTPTFTSINAVGCDSVTTLHLTVNYSNAAIELLTACDSLSWHGNTYTVSTTTPTFTSLNAVGCDSVTTLNLTVYYSNTATEVLTTCDSLTWHGNTYTASTTTPTFTSLNAVGCDSVTTLNLTVNYSNTATETITTCDSLIWHGNTYTVSTTTPTFTSLNALGCDSITTLHLTVNYSNTAIETLTACDSLTWHDSTYYSSTLNAQFSTHNLVGCDSVTTLLLTINYSNSAIETITACDSLTWHDSTYSASTSSPQFTTSNSYGCDSVTTLYLTINYSVHDTIEEIAVDSFFWDGQTLTESGTYPFEGETSEGCDSIVILNLIIIHDSTFVNNVDGDDISLYPNPTKASVTIEGTNIQAVRVYSAIGQEVLKLPANNQNRLTIDIDDLPDGFYIFAIDIHDGTAYKKVVKKK